MGGDGCVGGCGIGGVVRGGGEWWGVVGGGGEVGGGGGRWGEVLGGGGWEGEVGEVEDLGGGEEVEVRGAG